MQSNALNLILYNLSYVCFIIMIKGLQDILNINVWEDLKNLD